jgi:hypothetical protein
MKDLLPLQRMYNALSEEAKLFFHPSMLERSSPKWFLEQIMLALSCIESLRGCC